MVLACATVARADPTDPRDSPVLADFSEHDVVVEPKAPKETILAAVEAGLAAVCGSEGAPTNIQSYKGSFTAAYQKEDIHYAKCGEKMFGAKYAYAITFAGQVISSGESWKGKVVRAIDDLEGDHINEVLLEYSVTGVVNTHARFVSYTSGSETVVQDFGLVFTASDPTALDSCQERAAVIFMKTYDPTKMTRKDFHQPCGGDKEWSEIGPADLFNPN